MLIDEVEIEVRGGQGGNGVVAFRREKYVPRGGPSGGNGGTGGRVLLRADPGMRTLLDFTYHPVYKAARGIHGSGKQRTGKRGEDLVIGVPLGTVVRDPDTGERLADLTQPGQTLLVARGGEGGRGNRHFATPTRQGPRLCEKGLPGERRYLRLELELLADVGLIGMPNAGKSTLLSHISAARPQVAPYPFTTLEPHLGVVRLEVDQEFVVADMPGLVEGAHRGAGLGDQFLRHIRRTRLLLHLIDAAGVDGRDPLTDYETINGELQSYDQRVAALPQLIVLNKMDLPEARANLPGLQQELARRGLSCWPLSALTGEGIPELMHEVAHRLQDLEATHPEAQVEMHQELPPPPEQPLDIIQIGPAQYRARGTALERIVLQSDLSTAEMSHHYHERLRRAGLFRALKQASVPEGATVVIGDQELTYYPDK